MAGTRIDRLVLYFASKKDEYPLMELAASSLVTVRFGEHMEGPLS